MRRLLLALLAVAQVGFPDQIVTRAERLAFENPERAQLRHWTLPVARVEGVIGLWLAWTWETAWPGLRPIFGTVGLPALVLPQAVLDAALGVAYEDPDAIELKPWVRPTTRLLGLCYVIVAVWVSRSERPADSGAE